MLRLSLSCALGVTLFVYIVNVVQGLDDISRKSSSKPSDFKIKLAKSEFTETLKGSKPPLLTRFEEYDNSTNLDPGITFPPDQTNDTIDEDHHTYYNSTLYSSPEGKTFWIDLDAIPGNSVITHEMLSDSHRQATTVKLTFEYPFYGTPLRNITIATGGFLYMGDYLHNWIAATQYVAPLMANFDTGISEESTIKYYDNGTAFTVQWNKVYVQDRDNEGAFTFQVTLLQKGDIIFAYKEIPYAVLNISDEKHPVKIGISDAYILEKSIFFIRRKTIYEYHRIDMLKKAISNNTAIYFTALPTCVGFKDCESCLSADQKLECSWCEHIQRCSDGIDRMRQNWVMSGCTVKKDETCLAKGNIKPIDQSSFSSSLDRTTEISTKRSSSKSSTSKYQHSESDGSLYSSEVYVPGNNPFANDKTQEANLYVQEKDSEHSVSTGAVVTIVIFLIALMGASVWVVYAYKFPQTSSGQFLIKYRPSQWTFKKEENSSTNDSLHM